MTILLQKIQTTMELKKNLSVTPLKSSLQRRPPTIIAMLIGDNDLKKITIMN